MHPCIRISPHTQVRDLLPDYGAGFVAACLEAFGDNPETVRRGVLHLVGRGAARRGVGLNAGAPGYVQ